MQAALEKSTDSEASLQLLLFVDARLSSRKDIQRIRSYLDTLRAEYPFDLMIVDVGEHPYLAEHFKLVATPALIKIHPLPRQILAGSNLIAQLKNCWQRWQHSVEQYEADFSKEGFQETALSSSQDEMPQLTTSSVASSIELMQLSDEIFRLKQEKAELLERLQFKDKVMSMLAHDLRSPITAASLAVETLELDHKKQQAGDDLPQLTPALKTRLFNQARTQFRSMDRMIADLLESGRGSSTELNIRPQKLLLSQLCQNVLMQMKEQFLLKSQHIEMDIPQDLPCVYADEDLVRQVLLNLLDNAHKYTPSGGKILVSVLHRTTQKIQVSVCDNGLGVPEENRLRIFDDHFRLERDEAKDGYGLGLSLCQRIVRGHYGRIWVDAVPLGGACFHFTLPIYR